MFSQFQIPVFPEDLFFSTDLKEEIKEMEANTGTQGLVSESQLYKYYIFFVFITFQKEMFNIFGKELCFTYFHC